MNQHSVIVTFDYCEAMPDSSTRRHSRWAAIPFGPKTTEYENNKSYFDNMEKFIFDCFENGFVFVNDSLAIPVFNIHGFSAESASQQNQKDITAPVTTQKPNIPSNISRRDDSNRNNKIKHRHRRNRTQASSSLPFKVNNPVPEVAAKDVSQVTDSIPPIDKDKAI